MNNKHDRMYLCEPENEFIRVSQYKSNDEIYVRKYVKPCLTLSFFDRVRICYNFLFKPETDYIHGDFFLSNKIARKLGEDLMSITSEKPKNMELGQLKEEDTLKVKSIKKEQIREIQKRFKSRQYIIDEIYETINKKIQEALNQK